MNRVEKQSQEDLSVPISRERRKLLSGIAASCAAIASTTIGLSSASAVSEAAPQVGQQESQASCERRKVVASDRVTVVETSAGKVRGFERSGVFIFKGIPYGASTSGANRFMPPMKPEPWAGIRNALAYGRICPQEDFAHTLIQMARTWRTRTKMLSCFIEGTPSAYLEKTACVSTFGRLRSMDRVNVR